MRKERVRGTWAALALAWAACGGGAGQSRGPAAPVASGAAPSVRVEEISLTVRDLEAAMGLFADALGGTREAPRPALALSPLRALYGVFEEDLEVASVRFGDERIVLRRAPAGARGYREGAHSNDLDFQHLALVTGDIDGAWARVMRSGAIPVSPEPQRIPDTNPDAGGIRAAYFRDAEGHPLELIWYPPGRGDPRWQALPHTPTVSGIDHSAIASSSTEESVRFWVDLVGLRVAGRAHNEGVEQAALSGVEGARVEITGMRGDGGPPGVELLEYAAPGPGRAAREDASAADLTYYEIAVRVGDLDATAARLERASVPFRGPAPCPGCEGRAIVTADPDGHAVQLRGR